MLLFASEVKIKCSRKESAFYVYRSSWDISLNWVCQSPYSIALKLKKKTEKGNTDVTIT